MLFFRAKVHTWKASFVVLLEMAEKRPSTHLCQVLYGIDKALAYEWISEGLDPSIDQTYVLLGQKKGHLFSYLKNKQIQVFYIHFNGSKSSYPRILFKLFWLFVKIRPDVVHAHLAPIPTLAMVAAWLAIIPMRIQTRHYSTLHHEYAPKAVILDRIANFFSHKIIAISQVVADVLKERENVPEKKIEVIHHGFQLETFSSQPQELTKQLSIKYKLEGCWPVMGVIARFEELKGHKYIIDAFYDLLRSYPRAVIVLANAKGPDKRAIVDHLRSKLPAESYRLIPFEPQIGALYQLLHVYVHVPIDPQIEAFGMTYVEALAAGVPSVFTLSGIAHSFIQHDHNALVVDYCNSDSIKKAVLRLLSEPDLRKKLVLNGRASVEHNFNFDRYLTELVQLYKNAY